MDELDPSKNWPKGWTAEKEAEYQRKESLGETGICPLCSKILGHGHIMPIRQGCGYAHRQCVLKTNDNKGRNKFQGIFRSLNRKV